MHYESYHPHFVYTLLATLLAWCSIALYCLLRLRYLPGPRVMLAAQAIALPLYCEAGAYMFTLIRPAATTPAGIDLIELHDTLLQYRLAASLDSLLDFPLAAWLVLAVCVALCLLAAGSVLRWVYGSVVFTRALADAQPIEHTRYGAVARRFRALVAEEQRTSPPIMVLNLCTPLACTTGILRPRICLTPQVLDLLTEDEALAVLCHEWAHIVRRDLLWLAVVRFMRDITCFLAGTHLFWRAMILSQDEACDLIAARLTGQPLTLARTLVKVAQSGQRDSAFVITASMFAGTYTHVQLRVERMIELSDARPVLYHLNAKPICSR